MRPMSLRSTARTHQRDGERGQILVIFTLAIVAICAGVGLVLDGGSAYGQRRDEQNIADTAAMAGAYAYLNTTGTPGSRETAAQAAARQLAAASGYTDGSDGVAVTVTTSGSAISGNVQVDVMRPHRNTFAGLLGMPTWNVSVTATAQASNRPNAAKGAMPLLFNAKAFPAAICDESKGDCVPEIYQEPGTGNEDVPQDATQFNWTVFCTASGNTCNGDSKDVEQLIKGRGNDTTVTINQAIGPLNAGSHTTLFGDLSKYVGEVFPVPIVNDAGQMQGFAYFKLTGTEGSSDKVIKGYFVSPINASQLEVRNNGGNPTLDTGVFVVKLSN